VEVRFDEGVKILKFTYRGGDGHLFNFNWFDLEFIRDLTDTVTSAPTPVTLQSYPNPFVSSAQIVFTLERTSNVDLQIFNSSGSLISAPVTNQKFGLGRHLVTWDGTNGSSFQAEPGIYLIRMRSNNGVIHRKIILLTRE
jgi:flagellar hook assembly protein FlgD